MWGCDMAHRVDGRGWWMVVGWLGGSACRGLKDGWECDIMPFSFYRERVGWLMVGGWWKRSALHLGLGQVGRDYVFMNKKIKTGWEGGGRLGEGQGGGWVVVEGWERTYIQSRERESGSEVGGKGARPQDAILGPGSDGGRHGYREGGERA